LAVGTSNGFGHNDVEGVATLLYVSSTLFGERARGSQSLPDEVLRFLIVNRSTADGDSSQ